MGEKIEVDFGKEEGQKKPEKIEDAFAIAVRIKTYIDKNKIKIVEGLCKGYHITLKELSDAEVEEEAIKNSNTDEWKKNPMYYEALADEIILRKDAKERLQ